MADIQIQDNFILPPSLPSRSKHAKREKYPFGKLAVGQGFEADLSHFKDAYGFHNIVRAAGNRHGFTFQVRVDSELKRGYVRRSA